MSTWQTCHPFCFTARPTLRARKQMNKRNYAYPRYDSVPQCIVYDLEASTLTSKLCSKFAQDGLLA
ncbi:hypothetical protein KIN20_018581 [Parelaphostrongylus tenuis]|uniref:Uncharacterized protein n=1 Tax=Parelaphostrongylus tenuis TaxID=148309 RepID=A0AAD5MK58_PARTN|nr:hypothetical protein KIN20_018581 [Parelaphostrongylus tenuis]